VLPHVVLEVVAGEAASCTLKVVASRKVLLELFHRVGDGLGRFTFEAGSSSWGRCMWMTPSSEPTTLHTPTGDFTFARKISWPTSTREMSQRLMVFTSVTIGRRGVAGSKKGSNDPGIHREGFSRLLETKYENCAIKESRAGETRVALTPDA